MYRMFRTDVEVARVACNMLTGSKVKKSKVKVTKSHNAQTNK